MREEIIYIQHMDSPRDILLVSQELEQAGVRVKEIELGTASFINSANIDLKEIEKALAQVGYKVLQKQDKDFAEKVKQLLELYLDKLATSIQAPLVSDFLEEEMGQAYSTISKRFRKIEEKTIEKYLIGLKMGKVKNLLHSTDLSIKDISLQLNYSNPRSLARKFREVTGCSLNDFKKKNKIHYRMAVGF